MFILFAYNVYYPAGGPGDIKGVYDLLDEAIDDARDLRSEEHARDYIKVYDVMNRQVVFIV